MYDVNLAPACAELYRVRAARAQAILGEVDRAVRDWRDEADILGLGRSEIAMMERVIAA